MKIYTNFELANKPYNDNAGWEEDAYGQKIICTGIYRWSDGTHRDQPDPSFKQNLKEIVCLARIVYD